MAHETIERRIAGVAAGLAIANTGALAAFVAAWRLLGPDHALDPATWRESNLFAGIMVGLSVCAGALGGLACVSIARRRWVVGATAIILLAWWGAENAVRLGSTRDDACVPRAPEMPFVDGVRAGLVQEPTWSLLATPLAIGLGIVLGGAARTGADDAPRS